MNNFGCRIAPAAFAVAAACRRIASVAGTAVEVAECIEELVDAVAFVMASAAARTAVVAVLEWLARVACLSLLQNALAIFFVS